MQIYLNSCSPGPCSVAILKANTQKQPTRCHFIFPYEAKILKQCHDLKALKAATEMEMPFEKDVSN